MPIAPAKTITPNTHHIHFQLRLLLASTLTIIGSVTTVSLVDSCFLTSFFTLVVFGVFASADFFVCCGSSSFICASFPSGLCPNSDKISTISLACLFNFFRGSFFNSSTSSSVLGCSIRFSTLSLSVDSALKVTLLYPSIIKSSPVAIFTLLRGDTAFSANTPRPLIFTCLSCLRPSIMLSSNALRKLSASCSEQLVYSTTALRSSCHVNLLLAISYAFFNCSFMTALALKFSCIFSGTTVRCLVVG